ncbi:MAG TPA: Crp/Fnr family transcriptional regulator [Nannocystis exedens]|nr:Crp/Fnr family transcriptional regulator [Nannocystis exedens]
MTGVSEMIDVIPMLRVIPGSERAPLLTGARVSHLSHHEALFREGGRADRFSFPIEGWIKLSKIHASGRVVIICLVGPGQLICGNAVYAGKPYCCSALAATKRAQILSVPRYDLVRFVERYPEVTRGFLREITCRGMQLCHRIEELTSGKVERRLAALFVRLLPADTGLDGAMIPLALTRQELADLCGSTVETAIRAMRRLDERDVLRTIKTGFVVIDPETLRGLAGHVGD